MTHLTEEEIIEFVSFDKLTEETIALSKKVNEHILSCSGCFEKVSAYQRVYEEFGRIPCISDVDRLVYEITEESLIKAKLETEIKKEIASLGGEPEERRQK